MKDNQIILKDGTVIDDCSIAYDESLWIYCPLTMREAADIFLDAEKTKEIRFVMPANVRVFINFTDPQILNVVPTGMRVLMIGKETNVTLEPREYRNV